MKKDKAIVLGATKDLAFAVGTFLIGLQKHSPDLVDNVIIYHDGFAEQDKDVIAKICANVIFRNYTLEILQDKLKMDMEKMAAAKHMQRYTHMVFCVYEIFSLLSEYRQVLWCDVDVLVKGDIAGLFTLTDIAMGWSITCLNKSLGIEDTSEFFKGIDGKKCYYNSGLIIANDNIDYNNIYNKCYEYTAKFFNTLTLLDQAILSLALNVTKTKVNIYHKNTIASYDASYIDQALLIHGLASGKFWSNTISYHVHYEYGENYKKYLQLGGTPHSLKMTDTKYVANFSKHALMRHFKMIKFWEKIYGRIQFAIPPALKPSLLTTRDFLQFYLDGIVKSIHYELLYINETKVQASLHIEDPILSNYYVSCVLKNDAVLLSTIKQSNILKQVQTPNRYSLECEILVNDASYALTYIYTITINSLADFYCADKEQINKTHMAGEKK